MRKRLILATLCLGLMFGFANPTFMVPKPTYSHGQIGLLLVNPDIVKMVKEGSSEPLVAARTKSIKSEFDTPLHSLTELRRTGPGAPVPVAANEADDSDGTRTQQDEVSFVAPVVFPGQASNRRSAPIRLSTVTKKLLQRLDRPVTIYLFDRASGFQRYSRLLSLYSSASHYLTVRYIDPNRAPALVRRFDVRNYGSIYIVLGQQRVKASDPTEQSITEAIVRVLMGEATICFVEGHGERELNDVNRKGYSKFERFLADIDARATAVNIKDGRPIVSSCDLLVIAGPKDDYSPTETGTIRKYVNNGGRAMLMLDAGVKLPNLEKLMGGWGIKVRNDLVLDWNRAAVRIFGKPPHMPVILHYGSNPIGKQLEHVATLFPLTRSFGVSMAAPADVSANVVCQTSKESFGVEDFNPNVRQVSFRPGKDIKGPLAVAVASTISAKGLSKGEGRVVAFGTSLLPANAYLGFQANRELLRYSIRWLLGHDGSGSAR